MFGFMGGIESVIANIRQATEQPPLWRIRPVALYNPSNSDVLWLPIEENGRNMTERHCFIRSSRGKTLTPS